MIFVIMYMTVLFVQLKSPFQYYHPDKMAKQLAMKLNIHKTHCTTYKAGFCCNG